MTSKDALKQIVPLRLVESPFNIRNDFLYYKGVRVANCRHNSRITNGMLFVTKDNIMETYIIENETHGINYDIHDGLLRVFDDEKNLVKIFTFEEKHEMNDGILLKGNRTMFLKTNGEEEEIKEDIEINNDLLSISTNPYKAFYRKQMELKHHINDIDLQYNIIIPKLIIRDNLYELEDQPEDDLNPLFSKLPDNDSYLIERMEDETSFDTTSDLLLFLNGVFLCKGRIPIKNIIMMSSFTIKSKLLEIVVTNRKIFMIYNEFTAYKSHSEIIYHIEKTSKKDSVPQAFTLNGTMSLSDLYLTLSLFSDLPVVLNGLESFLFDLFIYTNLTDKFISKILYEEKWNYEIESVLCNVYRLVDDKNKRILDKYIQGESMIDLGNIKKIIIFNHHLIPQYIERCIDEHKEYEIEDLIEHYRSSDILDFISVELLKHNCFYLFTLCHPEYEKSFNESILKIEKYNLMSQRKRNL